MNVEIFETRNMGIVAAEVITSDGDCCGGGCGKGSWYVKNPKALQLIPSQQQEGQMIPHWIDLVQKPLLVDEGGYETTFYSCDYKVVTDKFRPELVDHYKTLEGEQPEAPEVQAGNVVDIFGEE